MKKYQLGDKFEVTAEHYEYEIFSKGDIVILHEDGDSILSARFRRVSDGRTIYFYYKDLRHIPKQSQ